MTQVFKVRENIWCIRRRSYLTCSYAVSIGSSLVFIDAGMNSDGSDIEIALKELGMSGENIRGVLLTHWHNDHSAGAAYLEKKYKVPVYAHNVEAKILSKAPQSSLKNKLGQMIPEAGPLVLLKGLLQDGPSYPIQNCHPIEDGMILFEQFVAIESPGHTSGHLAFYDLKNEALFAGDCLAIIHGKIRRMARVVTEDLKLGHASMEKILSYPVKTICPGHREPLLEAEKEIEIFRERLKASSHWPLLG